MYLFFLPESGVKKTSVDTFSASYTCRHIGYGDVAAAGDEIGSIIQSHHLKIMAAAITTAAKCIYFVAGHVKT
jgi:hypothetical protein